MNLVIIGAGRIGRGFAAEQYKGPVTFVHSNAQAVESLAAAGEYKVLADTYTKTVRDFNIYLSGTSLARRAILKASVIVVCVKPPAFSMVRDALFGATGQVCVVSNKLNLTTAFPGAAHICVERMATRFCGLDVVVEDYARATASEPNPLYQVSRGPEVPAKLCIDNLFQFALAWYGTRPTLAENVADPIVAEKARAIMGETAAALSAKCGIPVKNLHDRVESIATRVANPRLLDPTERILGGRDGLAGRMHGSERVGYALNLCAETQTPHPTLLSMAGEIRSQLC